MQETVDSVLAKVEEHDKALQQKLISSPSQTQTSNTAVPPATVVPPLSIHNMEFQLQFPLIICTTPMHISTPCSHLSHLFDPDLW